MTFTVIVAVAEFRTSLILERVAMGLNKARRCGIAARVEQSYLSCIVCECHGGDCCGVGRRFSQSRTAATNGRFELERLLIVQMLRFVSLLRSLLGPSF
jgi:hypothetical protein